MCGIAGYIDYATPDADELRWRAGRMSRALQHRGPDDHGVWVDSAAGVALAHRRLSIIDLSSSGAQPMSVDGRYTIVYNGEIYNFRELRADLARIGERFRGDSDTEVVLAAIRHWGIEPALQRFNGMFAFALWDAATRELTLARDRMGEKPLYYGWHGHMLLFGSELKALRAHPAFRGTVDPSALSLYLRHGYVPSPYTIYAGTMKLPAGTRVTVRPEWGASARPNPVEYWSLGALGASEPQDGIDASDEQRIGALETLLGNAVGIRMISDVPLGAFLSGGIDSSLVVALMQRNSSSPVRTFSIGFSEKAHDEAPFARRVAAHLGTDHTELIVTPQVALGIIPSLPAIYDEPFGDSSAIPTTVLSALTREHVTVALSGDGGDELFGGYTRYGRAEKAWRARAMLPGPARQLAAGALRRLAARHVGDVAEKGRAARMGRLAGLLESRGHVEQYGAMTTYWSEQELQPGVRGYDTAITDAARWRTFDDPTQSLMYCDALMYLPDDILVKVDRASMWSSLEARVPMLDHRVVEHAWGLPREMRVRGGKRKWILRQILARHVPSALFERPKAGFRVPVGEWLRGPLREWAESLLAPELLVAHQLSPEPVLARWREHQTGRVDHTDRLWIVLMFQAWLAAQGSAAGVVP